MSLYIVICNVMVTTIHCFFASLQASEEIWTDTNAEDEDHIPNASVTVSPWVRMITVFLLLWQFLYRVSDSAMDSLFFFFCKVFKSFKTAGDLLPDITSSYKSAINLIAIKRSFTEYVVCPKCHSLYLYEDCVENRANYQRISKYYKFVGFPNYRCRQLQSATYTLTGTCSVSLLFLICTVPVISSDRLIVMAGNNKDGLHFSFISDKEFSTSFLQALLISKLLMLSWGTLTMLVSSKSEPSLSVHSSLGYICSKDFFLKLSSNIFTSPMYFSLNIW